MQTLQLPLTENNVVWVYSLHDPETGRIRYVGITARPKARLREHCTEDAHTHRGNWIQELIARGLKPEMRFIEATTSDAWEERERWWIAHYREQGESLTNTTDGGHGALNPGLDAREKLASISEARWADPDMREKMIAGMRRTQQTPEERARKSEASKANAAHLKKEREKLWQDPAHIEKMREVGRAVTDRLWADPVYRERIAESNRRTIAEHMKNPEYATRRSATSKARMAAMRADPELMARNKAAVIAAAKASWADPEKRAARIAAIKAAWARRKAAQT